VQPLAPRISEAISARLQQIHRPIEKYVMWRYGRAELAAEAAQETVLRLIQSHGRGKVCIPLLTLEAARQCARWALADLYRRRGGRGRREGRPLPEQVADRRALGPTRKPSRTRSSPSWSSPALSP
jgi:hypothetical protein